MQNIEFAKELQKSVATIVTDVSCTLCSLFITVIVMYIKAQTYLHMRMQHEKAQKKQQKKEKAERAAAEQKRFRELLDMQALLDGLGEDKTRNDFLHGTNGAAALSEADLELLDKLYTLICPSREESAKYVM